MNITDHRNAIHKQANQMRSASWSLVFAAIAAYLVWTFGGAPWWVYMLLFTRFFLDLLKGLLMSQRRTRARWHGKRVGCPKTDQQEAVVLRSAT
jgi:hypothetical protein